MPNNSFEFKPALTVKWLFLVTINTPVCLILAWGMVRSVEQGIGVAIGIIVWLIFYVGIAHWLVAHHPDIERMLGWIVAIFSLSQFIPMLQMAGGMAALHGFEWLMSSFNGVAAFGTTFLTGGLLSLAVGICLVAVLLLRKWLDKKFVGIKC